MGWDASPNFETSTAGLIGNGRTSEGLGRMKPWLSLGKRLPDAVKVQLRQKDVDYSLESSSGNASELFIRPGTAHAATVADPLISESCAWSAPKRWGAGRLGVRVRALSALPSADNATDLLLLHKGSGAVRDTECSGPSTAPPALALSSSRKSARSAIVSATGGLLNFSVVEDAPGEQGKPALRLNMTSESTEGVGCFRSRFPAPLDLSSSRVLEFTVYGDGSGALLDVELEDAGAYFREFFLYLNFSGWRTIRPALPDTRRLYNHSGGRMPQPGDSKMAMRNFASCPFLSRLSVPRCEHSD